MATKAELLNSIRELETAVGFLTGDTGDIATVGARLGDVKRMVIETVRV